MNSVVTGLALLALSVGCEAEDERPRGGGGGDEGAGGATGGSPGLGGSPGDDQQIPGDGVKVWITVIDATEGLGLGEGFGSDIDAVGWVCPGARGSGWATRVFAKLAGLAEAAEQSGALATGEPDCEGNAEPCALTLGPSGWAAFETEVTDLTDCTIRVVEQADAPEDAFEVYVCPTADAEDADCNSNLVLSGRDGDDASGECTGGICRL